MALNLNSIDSDQWHLLPGYVGPRVLGPKARRMFAWWDYQPKRRPHQGERECARRAARVR